MLQVTPQMRVVVAVASVDFRRGIDGLAQVVRERLSMDPFSGAVFVFRNKGQTAIKVLVDDGQGYWLCQSWPSSVRRFDGGRASPWYSARPSRNQRDAKEAARRLGRES